MATGEIKTSTKTEKFFLGSFQRFLLMVFKTKEDSRSLVVNGNILQRLVSKDACLCGPDKEHARRHCRSRSLTNSPKVSSGRICFCVRVRNHVRVRNRLASSELNAASYRKSISIINTRRRRRLYKLTRTPWRPFPIAVPCERRQGLLCF